MYIVDLFSDICINIVFFLSCRRSRVTDFDEGARRRAAAAAAASGGKQPYPAPPSPTTGTKFPVGPVQPAPNAAPVAKAAVQQPPTLQKAPPRAPGRRGLFRHPIFANEV